jgi:hypothetical protein
MAGSLNLGVKLRFRESGGGYLKKCKQRPMVNAEFDLVTALSSLHCSAPRSTITAVCLGSP